MKRQTLIPHNDRIILRLTVPLPKSKDFWYLWCVYKIKNSDDAGVNMSLENIYSPDGEDRRQEVPEELEGLSYFEA